MEIEEPSVLTRLPRTDLREHGRVQIAQVYGLSGSTKKKRHELCAAVDGNSVNIIEVVNGNILSSYPVPPDARFLCSPSCSRSQISKTKTLRKTYCLVGRRDVVSIQCYMEQKAGDSSQVQSLGMALQEDCDDVILLQPSADDEEVLVLQKTGRGMIFTENATVRSRQFQLGGVFGSLKVFAARWLSMDDAKASVLKSRSDLFTSMTNNASLVMGICQSPSSEELRLAVWPVPSAASGDIGQLRPIVDHCISLGVSNASVSSIKVNFVQKGQRVEAITADTHVAFDITGVVPRKVSEQQHLISGKASILDLSNDLVLSATPSTLQIFNTRYRSLIASISTKSASLKRKRDSPKMGESLSLVLYFSQLKRAVGLAQNQLVAIDIRPEDKSQSLKRNSLLLGSIGRGSSTSQRHESQKPTKIGKPRRTEPASTLSLQQSEKSDNLETSDEIEKIEAQFKEGLTGDSHSLPKNAAAIPDSKLDHLIASLFDVIELAPEANHGSSGRLRLKLPSFELVQWCIEQGLLSRFRIERALSSSQDSLQRANLKPEAIALSLMEANDSLNLLQFYVERSSHLDHAEIAILVRELVRKAIRQSSTYTDSTAIPMPTESTENPHIEKSLTSLPASSEQGISSRLLVGQCLRVALTRFASIGQSNVLAEMKTLMHSTDILALIQFLRQQLFLGGYTRLLQTSSFPTPPPSRGRYHEVEKGSKTTLETAMPLKIIVTLLSSCVDAIGPFGLRSLDDEEKFIKTLIPDLLSEISSASDALEESVYLQGLLRETLRYADSVQQQPQHIKAQLETPNKDYDNIGSIMTLYSEPNSEIPSTVHHSALPVTLRVDGGISKTKVRKGGGQSVDRSSREMAMLQDRQRSAYSFERLIL